MKLSNFIKRNIYFVFFLLTIFIFFNPLFSKGYLPIPSDTMVGMYYPFRDIYAKDYPNGIPFKNFLITDPIRQTYPWKNLSIEMLSKFSLPLWNPYEMAGKPLLANFQSSPFYPLNIFLFAKPFYLSWSFFIFLQQILAGFFLYLYLKNLNLDKRAIFLGLISFTFSGFFISWLEWGTIVHTALWLPLILLSIDKIFETIKLQKSNIKNQISKGQIKNKQLIIWSGIFVFSLVSSFFAGHLQVFFYLFIFSTAYLSARWLQFGRMWNASLLFASCYLLAAVVTAIQWIPTLRFISLSARYLNQQEWLKDGWFIPWQHLFQFVIPDFFGNPTTMNYWGVWNYGELVGYIGVIPLFFALFSMFFRFDKKTLFFGSAIFISLVFSLPTPIAKIPYQLNLPFLSTAQPTRILFIICFSLSVLAALGFDYFLKLNISKKSMLKRTIFVAIFLAIIFVFAYLTLIFYNKFYTETLFKYIAVSKRNVIFPLMIFISGSILILSFIFLKNKNIKKIIAVFILIISVFELLRFGIKFDTFSKKEYLFPMAKTINFLKSQNQPFRIASFNSEIFPPNFATFYRLQSIEVYDPLFLLSYGEFITALSKGKADLSNLSSFNRMITPRELDSNLIDLLNVKYVITFCATDLNDDLKLKTKKFEMVFKEVKTCIYENKNVYDRAFFVKNLLYLDNKESQLKAMFLNNLKETAIIEASEIRNLNLFIGKAEIVNYKENRVTIKTENINDGFLVLTDNYYPSWKVLIDDKESRIYKTDYIFRGVFVPKGQHEIIFYDSLF